MGLFIFESYVNNKIPKAYEEELPEELLEGVPEGEEAVTVPGVPAKEIPPGAWYLCLVVFYNL